MNREITVELPEELFEPLLKRATEEGKSVEAVAKDCLADALNSAPGARLRKWCGAKSSNIPDASLRHDEYLGQAILGDSQGQRDA